MPWRVILFPSDAISQSFVGGGGQYLALWQFNFCIVSGLEICISQALLGVFAVNNNLNDGVWVSCVLLCC